MSLNLTDSSEACRVSVLFIVNDDYFTAQMLEIYAGARA